MPGTPLISLAAVAVLATGAAGVGVTAHRASEPQRALAAAGPWINTPGLMAPELRGKVVLVNFWTYSCINSTRALPYVRAWAEKYRDRGLVVVGVHTPEFGFERDKSNVARAVAALGVGYPVALDSGYATWNAFGNNAWPAFYFIDAEGRVRRRAIGEGSYDESERLIQKLLTEATGTLVADPIVPVAGQGVEAAPGENDLASDETYVGYARASGFASPGGVRRDETALYRAPPALRLNQWSLEGRWTMEREFASPRDSAGRVTFRFHARDLHLILGPAAGGKPVRFKLTLDGHPPGADHGVDIGSDGAGVVTEPRMYQLVRQKRPVADRTFEIEFQDPNVRVYDFTFG